jgi:hypothetical protein
MQEGDGQLKITIETLVKVNLNTVWAAWNNPEDRLGSGTRAGGALKDRALGMRPASHWVETVAADRASHPNR